nr:gamma-glutamylcyclotransferase family protein [Clostridium polynesiense]
MEKKLYIAYGSNMDTEQMAYRCPDAKVVCTSEIRGYELLFKGSKIGACATIEKKENSKVPVLVWEISQCDERSLDRYEGYPRLYYKKNLNIYINDKPMEAMVYIMDEKRLKGQPSYQYYKLIEDAYKKYGFDFEILEKALKTSVAEGMNCNDQNQ